MNRRPARTEPDGDGFYADPVLPQPFGPAVAIDRRHVPECWDQHWEVVEELAALHLAWEGAYATTAQSDAPLAWHERFATARPRLSESVHKTGGRPGKHTVGA